MKTKLYTLVYQCGLANVFRVKRHTLTHRGRDARRVLQGSFRECEAFARGLQEAGAKVEVAACNNPGDIADYPWTDELENQPFSEQFQFKG